VGHFPVIALFFSGLLKRALEALTALLGIIGRHPWQCAVIALLALSAWLWRGKGNALDERDAARAETAALVVTYRKAQAEAEAAQIAANIATEAHTARLARKADNDLQNALNDAHRLRDAYADRMRITAACRPARVANPGPENSPAPDRDGPGESPDMVAVTREDFDTLTDNTIRLEAVHDWGQSLIKDKLALPEVAF